MRLFIVICLLPLFSIHGFTQNEWFPINAEWYYSTSSSSSENFFTQSITGDTNIAGRDAKIFGNKDFLSTDNDGNKVYRYIEEIEEWTLLYDFTAQEGDTLTHYAGQNEFFKITIDSISNLVISGDTFLVQHISRIGPIDVVWGNRNIQFMGNDAFMVPIFLLVFPLELRCYFPSPERQYSLVSFACDLVPTESRTSIAQTLTIYPNPIKDILFIEDNHFKPKHTKLYIYNAQGQIVRKGLYISNEISVADLQKGIYVISIHTQEGKSYCNKFMKH